MRLADQGFNSRLGLRDARAHLGVTAIPRMDKATVVLYGLLAIAQALVERSSGGTSPFTGSRMRWLFYGIAAISGRIASRLGDNLENLYDAAHRDILKEPDPDIWATVAPT